MNSTEETEVIRRILKNFTVLVSEMYSNISEKSKCYTGFQKYFAEMYVKVSEKNQENSYTILANV